VLKLFVKRELMDIETAQGMLAWPHSGFHVHDGVRVGADERDFAVRLARYCARNPVALGRMEYQEEDSTVTYHSDKPTGPTAGSETVDALEFLARVVSHIPNKGQVLQRYYGWYASRVRGMRRKASEAGEEQPVVCVDPEPAVLSEAGKRWAELLRRIFEVDPLACPRCGQEMRMVAFITEPKTIASWSVRWERSGRGLMPHQIGRSGRRVSRCSGVTVRAAAVPSCSVGTRPPHSLTI
jgi:hypothetical protein